MRVIREKEYLTIEEAAEFTGCTTTQLANWRSKGYETGEHKGPKFAKLGREVLYDKAELNDFLDKAGV